VREDRDPRSTRASAIIDRGHVFRLRRIAALIMYTQADRDHMRAALALAQRALFHASPNPRVGCVLVRDGRVIGEGYTQPPGSNHAEIEALLDARRNGNDAHGATAYVTLEPCAHFGRTPPCTTALIEAP